MRFLVINHPRLGASPGGVPDHLVTDRATYSTRAAWFRAVEHAITEQVHAVFLTGEIVAHNNRSLEPFGPLVDGISQLHQANIPVVAVSDGSLTPSSAQRFNLDHAVQFIDDVLDWVPPIHTNREHQDGSAIHVIPASLAESDDAPVREPITLADMDYPGSTWILTEALQPDSMRSENALIVEPGSLSPLDSQETGEHGVWLVNTDAQEAVLVPLANLEFTSIAIDVASAEHVEDVERIIAQAAISAADCAPSRTLLVDATLTGATRLYPVLPDIADELLRTLTLEHNGVSIAFTNFSIDATPLIDLEPLVGRPDPVGEIARLLHALRSGNELSDSQVRLITAVDQKLLAVSHGRVFGSIVDSPLSTDSHTLLQRQAWAALDTMVRQRGID